MIKPNHTAVTNLELLMDHLRHSLDWSLVHFRPSFPSSSLYQRAQLHYFSKFFFQSPKFCKSNSFAGFWGALKKLRSAANTPSILIWYHPRPSFIFKSNPLPLGCLLEEIPVSLFWTEQFLLYFRRVSSIRWRHKLMWMISAYTTYSGYTWKNLESVPMVVKPRLYWAIKWHVQTTH